MDLIEVCWVDMGGDEFVWEKNKQLKDEMVCSLIETKIIENIFLITLLFTLAFMINFKEFSHALSQQHQLNSFSLLVQSALLH